MDAGARLAIPRLARKKMHNRKVYIETVGCQMNELDSELVVAALRRKATS